MIVSQPKTDRSTTLNNQSSINMTACSSVIIYGKEDESKFFRDMEEKNRIERIKQVRLQEKLATK